MLLSFALLVIPNQYLHDAFSMAQNGIPGPSLRNGHGRCPRWADTGTLYILTIEIQTNGAQ
jgi:hypothetical protein